ncbi:MAG TPA: penicillin acylase family protein, partial [Candidatus Limnocylindrales bacterium]|nr:penicillin acylase family protein [Candidatus Limnocylindrales bacterium]
VPELFECQRDWIDPVNNMLAADTQGSIGYLTRGRLPLRSSTAHHQVPAAGWTGEHEWIGFVPFEAMPRAIDPPEGFVVSANQVVSDRTSPFIAYSFNDPFRAERIVELLARAPRLSPQEIARIQGDVTSWPAQRWAACLRQAGPFEGPAERARERLSAWDGELAPGSANALLYACFRRALAGELFRPRVGDPVWGWLTTTGIPAAATLIRRWLANAIWPSLRAGRLAPALEGPVRAALAFAWGEAAALAGPDPSAWRWDAYHRTDARHPLAPRHPEAAWLNPAAVSIGGDSDTVQVASYGWQVGTRFDIGNVSVYRQVVDLAALDEASSVIPGGASGDPSSPHASDQLPLWSSDRRIPMSGA